MVQSNEASAWTVDTLREHITTLIAANDVRYNQRFEASQSAINTALIAQQTAMQAALTAQKLAVDTALAAADRAVTKAELSADKRFESINEFRGTLSDQQRTLMPRSEAELLMKAMTERIDTQAHEIGALRELRSASSGKFAGANTLWGYLVGVAGITLALIFHFIK